MFILSCFESRVGCFLGERVSGLGRAETEEVLSCFEGAGTGTVSGGEEDVVSFGMDERSKDSLDFLSDLQLVNSCSSMKVSEITFYQLLISSPRRLSVLDSMDHLLKERLMKEI